MNTSERVTVQLIVASDGALRTLDQFDSKMTDAANASVRAGAGVDAFQKQLARQRQAMEAGIPVMKARAAAMSAEERALASVFGKADVVAKARIAAERDLSRAAAAASNLVVQGKLAEADATRQLMAIEAAHAAQVERAIAASAGRPGVATSNFNTANAAAQFQDIGVTAAMGMNPLQIALQQGTQLSAILGGQGLTSTVKTLGAAFASLLSPVSLVTIGVVALGAAGIQALMSLQDESKSAADLLEEHRTALDKIVQGYDAAETAVSDYAAQLERLPRAIATLQLNEQFDQVRQDVTNVTEQAAKFGNLFDGYGSSAEQAFAKVSAQFARGELSAEDYYLALQDVRGQLNGLESALGAVSVSRLIGQMEEGAMKAMAFGDAISNLVAQTHALAGLSVDSTLVGYFDVNSPEKAIEALKGLTPELRTQKQIIEDTYRAAMGNPVVKAGGADALTAAYEEAIAAQDEIERRRAQQRAASGGTASDRWGSSLESFQQRLAAQQLEISLIGQSTFEIERQRSAMDLLNQAKTAGLSITPELTAQIDSMTAAYARSSVELERLQMQQQQLAEINGALADGFKDLFKGLITGTKSANDAIADLLGKLGDLFLDRAFNMLFSGFGMGGGMGMGRGLLGGMIIPGILHQGGTAGADGYGHGKVYSPTVWANATRYHTGGIAGLRPDEVPAILQRGERVIPRNAANDNGAVDRSVVEVRLGPGLEASILQKAGHQAVQITDQAIRPIYGVMERSSGRYQ